MAKRSSREWQNIIEQQEASDVSVVDFCQQQQLNTKYFYARRRSLLKRRQAQQTSSFVKVSKVPVDNTQIVLQLKGARLSLPANIDADWLAQLLNKVSV